MARTPSFKGSLDLSKARITSGPVEPPKGSGPDLTQFVETLSELEKLRLSGSTANSYAFTLPTAGAQLARTRFTAAGKELGVGVRFPSIEAHDNGTETFYVATGVRRSHNPKGSAVDPSTLAGSQPAPKPVAKGLPKVAAKR